MDDVFEKLKQEKNNSVDVCVMWFQATKLIDSTKEAEEKVREMFSDVKDKQNVELTKFKDAIFQLALAQKKNLEEVTKRLGDHGPRLMEVVMAGASAFKEAFKK